MSLQSCKSMKAQAPKMTMKESCYISTTSPTRNCNVDNLQSFRISYEVPKKVCGEIGTFNPSDLGPQGEFQSHILHIL